MANEEQFETEVGSFVRGPRGYTGQTPGISADVETVEAGEPARIEKSGSNENPHLHFVLPRGYTGMTPKIRATAETGEPGTEAEVTQSGTDENPNLHFVIPRGNKGDGVLYDEAQQLTDGQKAQARSNMGAASAQEVSALKNDKLDKTGTAADSSKLGGKTLAEIMLALYPVGAVYISANSTSPASLFGGTWESIGGRFLLGADATYTAGSTGGEAAHTLTVSEMPNHYHDCPIAFNASGYNRAVKAGWTDDAPPADNSQSKSSSVGGSKPHNNMPPYLAVYMWKRVS